MNMQLAIWRRRADADSIFARIQEQQVRVGDAFEAELARVEVEENPFGTSSKNVTTEDSEDPF